jgi:hypothetical protein
MKILITAIGILVCFGLSRGKGIDSVTVDSVWNIDSSWYDGNGVLQQRSARDCIIGFISQGSGYVSCSLTVSLDSGRTWGAIPNPLQILDNSLSAPVQCGKKAHIKARVLGGNRQTAVFKIISNTCPITTVPIANLRLDNFSVQGWVDSSYIAGDTSELYNVIDGGAESYIQHGMRRFSRQEMDYDSSHFASITFYDFGTIQAAQSMFSYFVTNYHVVPWQTHDPRNTAISRVWNGTTVFAQINKYYFEIIVFIHSDDSSVQDSIVNLFYVKYLALLNVRNNPIKVYSPAGGQKVLAGDTLLVSWIQSVAIPKLSYTYGLGTGWQQFASVIPVDNYSAKAVLPTTSYSDNFQIEVEDKGGTYDAGFSAQLSLKYIVITFPTTGSTLTNGSTVTITWKDARSRLSSLRLLLSTDGGKSFGDILTRSILPDTTSSTWVIGSEEGAGAPFSFPSTNCILKIRDYVDDRLVDTTGTFSVQ